MKARFKIKAVTIRQNGFAYRTFKLTGTRPDGIRVRQNFKDRDEAEGEKLKLEIAASNAAVRSVITRLTAEQVTQAEMIFGLTPDPVAAIKWYLANYRPPVSDIKIEAARDAFIADREPHIGNLALRDHKLTLGYLIEKFPGKLVHEFKTAEILELLKSRGTGKKRFNNMRGDLCAFFNFCKAPSRKWVTGNPVEGITKFQITPGLPEILTPEKAAEVMAYVETYAGPNENHPVGCLAPYFALCLFAGIRPAVSGGEIAKLGTQKMSRVIPSSFDSTKSMIR
ncbi:MAG TPA: hypothetical protein VM029_22775 [Opitutaceae bacterium]|nr:hypothetical protein [Opitutaceae bacterium]